MIASWFGIDGQLQITEATRAAATFYYWLDQENKGTLGSTPFQYWVAAEVNSCLTLGAWSDPGQRVCHL